MTPPDIKNNQPLAVCLHASASSGRQGLQLAAELGGCVRTVTPDLVGYGGRSFRPGKRFNFDCEVDSVLRQVERTTGKSDGPLHLLGHSYGGAIALRLALARPQRVASLTLYEPAQFLLLFADGLDSAEAREILEVRRFVLENAKSPRRRLAAARRFIEYWSGDGAWDGIPAKRQRRFARLMPKVAAEFEAILSSGVAAADFAALDIPVRLIYGTRTRATARKVTEILAGVLPDAECIAVAGAAHMGPVTHADRINPLFAEHVIARLQVDLEAAA